MTPLLLVLLSQSPTPLNLNLQPVDVRDEGVRVSKYRSWAVDCRGAGVTCTADGGYWTLNVSGGGGGSSPSVTCAADQALSWDGANWLCTSKISAAFAADASVSAQALAADPAACGGGQYVTDVAAAGTLTCSTPPGTYVLPDATSGVTGGIRLTNELSGTAVAPQVVDDGHNHTGATVSALDTGDITTGTLAGARGGLGAAQATCGGGQFLTCNGTTCSCGTPSGGGGGGNVGILSVTFGDGTRATSDSAPVTVSAAWVTATSSITLTPACSQAAGSVTVQECLLVAPVCSVTAITAAASFEVTCVSTVGGFGSYPISYSGT